MTLFESKTAAEKDFSLAVKAHCPGTKVYVSGHTMAQAAAEVAFIKGYIKALPFLDEKNKKVSSFLKKYFGRCNVYSVARQYPRKSKQVYENISNIVCWHVETRLVDAILYTSKGYEGELIVHCLFAAEKIQENH